MKLSLVPHLACPDCGGKIRFSSLDRLPGEGEDVETGRLACEGCAREFPVENHVPRLLPRERLERRMRKTRASFGWEWDRYPGSLEEDRRIFLEETQIPESNWSGKLVLDAGCGMGRYASVARGLGAEVLALDLSDALLRMVPRLQADAKLHLVQGDLLRPPLRPGTFDIIYSQGVLHHTPSTRGAFRRLAPLVKPQGLLSVWVYGTPGSYASFSSNPLRRGRTWLRPILPLAWTVIWLRQILSDCLRVATVRLPIPVLYLFCYPLAALGTVPLVQYLTFSVHPNFRVRLIENFDWLAPPYQYKHTKEEMRGWFEEEGFTVLRQLAHGMVPKVGMLGRRTK